MIDVPNSLVFHLVMMIFLLVVPPTCISIRITTTTTNDNNNNNNNKGSWRSSLNPSHHHPEAEAITPGTKTETDDIDHQQGWKKRFSKLVNSKRGSRNPGISDLKKYMHRFGYLNNYTNSNNNSSSSGGGGGDDDENYFDDHLERALGRYQWWHGLPVTRTLDVDTLSAITAPRCGLPDQNHNHNHNYNHSYNDNDQGSGAAAAGSSSSLVFRSSKHFVYFTGQPRWDRSERPISLTYALIFSKNNNNNDKENEDEDEEESAAPLPSYLSLLDIRSAFRRAFDRWESVIPITFRETSRLLKSSADVKIAFYSGDHGDGEPFDGRLGVLAHAFSPESGRLHLDSAERWAVDGFRSDRSKFAVDLESVALHEIGHVLGLAHSMDRNAVMYPSLKPRTTKLRLTLDDVKGVQALYGSNPNFTTIQSETSYSSSSSSSSTTSFFNLPSDMCYGLLVGLLSLYITQLHT